jgi:hypothetical protein
MDEKKLKPVNPGPEPSRVNFEGDWQNLAERVVKQPAGKAPPRAPKPRKKPCAHENLAREVMFSQKTGDWLCQDCGETLTKEQVEAIRSANR